MLWKAAVSTLQAASTSNPMPMHMISTSVSIGGGTQYVEGNTTTAPTGNVLIWKSAVSTMWGASTSNPLPIHMISTSVAIGGGTQYVDGNTTTAPTGTVMMWKSAVSTIVPVTSSVGLPVNVIAGSLNANTEYIEGATTTLPTGIVMLWKSAVSTLVPASTSNPFPISSLPLTANLEVPSHEKFIPPEYLDARRSDRLALLQGLLDTDGWVERWGSVRFATTSKVRAAQVVELVRSLGGWCSSSERTPSYTYKGEKRTGRPAYTLCISHSSAKTLFSAPSKLERALESRAIQKRLTIRAVEASREAECRCISVSHPSRLYITNSYVVTHNTSFALNIGEHVAIDKGMPVAVFSMEMGAAQLALRMLSSVGRLEDANALLEARQPETPATGAAFPTNFPRGGTRA